MPGTLDQLLSRVVERKGYQILGADTEALFARRGEETLLAAWKIEAAITIEDAKMFLAAMEQVNAAGGILVALKGADPAAKEAFAATKVEVWAESRLVVEVGEAFVHEALGGSSAPGFPAAQAAPVAEKAPASRTKFPSLIAQGASAASGSGNGIAYFMPSKKKEQPADMQATIRQQRGGALGYAWGGAGGSIAGGASSAGIATTLPSKPRIKTDQWGNVVRGDPNAPNAAPTAVPVVNAEAEAYEIITTKKEKKATPTLKDASPPACTTLKVAVSKEEAIAKTGKPGTAKLALVPHVAFEFNLSMERPGMTAPVTGSGAILASSLTGELRQVDGLAYHDKEPADARKDAEKMTAVDLYDKVKGLISKNFSRTMNVEKEVAGNTVMSTLKLAPDPEEMGLEHKGMVYLPVWEVTGSTGVVKVDAFTGNVL